MSEAGPVSVPPQLEGRLPAPPPVETFPPAVWPTPEHRRAATVHAALAAGVPESEIPREPRPRRAWVWAVVLVLVVLVIFLVAGSPAGRAAPLPVVEPFREADVPPENLEPLDSPRPEAGAPRGNLARHMAVGAGSPSREPGENGGLRGATPPDFPSTDRTTSDEEGLAYRTPFARR